ncbi:MAG: YfhO family protein [Candidatus Coatesbacteria bacterium]|nr:YfhO family protein [Candidatus Coatesbacteria bacterium]
MGNNRMLGLLNSNRSLVAQVCLLLVLVSIFFGNALFSYRLYFYYDTIMQNFPFGQFFAEGFRQFELRLWCPQIFSGFPLFAEGQAGALYPLFAPLLLLAPFWVVYKYTIALHSFLAALFMLLFLRQMKLKTQSCLFGAVAFGFSGFFVAQVSHANIIRGYCYLPAVLLAIEAFRIRGARRWWLLPVIFGTFILGTHPYVAIYALIAVALWLLFALLEKRNETTPRGVSWARWFGAIGGIALGFGLAACQLIPSAELLEHASRGEDVSLEFLTAGSLPIHNLFTFLLPNFFGTPATNCYWGPGEIGLFAEFCCYVGVLTLLLAVVGLFCYRKGRVIYFGVLLAAGTLLAVGNQTPLYSILAKVPILNATRTPSRFIYLAVFAFSALSAYGVEYLLSISQKTRAKVCVSIFLAALIAGSGLLVHQFAEPNIRSLEAESSQPEASRALVSDESRAFFEHYREALEDDLTRFWAILSVSALLLLVIVIAPAISRHAAFVLPVVFFLDLLWFGHGFNPIATTKVYTKPRNMTKLLRADTDTFRTLRWRVNEIWHPKAHLEEGQRRADPFTPGWSVHLERYRDCTMSQVPNTNMLYDIDSVDGYTSFTLAKYNRLLGAPGKCALPRFSPSPGLMSLLNVKYVISSEAIDHGALGPVFNQDDLYLYRYRDFLPRFFLVDKAIVFPTEEDVLKAVSSETFWPQFGVILDAGQLEKAASYSFDSMLRHLEDMLKPKEDLERPARCQIDRIRTLEYKSDEVIVEADSDRSAFLVMSDNDYPGWKVFVNGEPAPILRAYGFLKAVALGPGKSTVRFVFEPGSFRIGLLVTLLSTLIVSCIAFAFHPTKRADTSSNTPCYSRWTTTIAWLIIIAAIGTLVVPYSLQLMRGSGPARMQFGSVIADVYCDAAAGSLVRGENESAKSAANSALMADLGNVRARYMLGVALYRLSDRASALQVWQDCLAIDPGYKPALKAIGQAGRRGGQ